MSPSIFRYENWTTRQDPTVEPEYRARCVSGDERFCTAASGSFLHAEEADDWMRDHMRQTGHTCFRRSFDDFAELTRTETQQAVPAKPVWT
ncbi:hypothetical protein GCM10010394_05260 [Streptomyces crystallinus]|uniref:DUF7848 domain-containing protein n=1 Tax=Streptomyces crystallinus TaxID=68191 RepID=A0ABN1F143_9ACTN